MCSCTGESLDFTELDEVLDEYKGLQGNLIIILQKAQDIYGYLPREVIERISNATGYTIAKIYGVATFYAQFRLQPIGKYLIMLCQGTACHVSGSQKIEEAVTEELGIADGETTEDRMFTLNNVACLGCCSLAPVMMIRTDEGEETYGNLTPDKAKEILRGIAAKENGEEDAV
ncbi:MAG: NADH-quinone oxidoreductase subunit NuoE [Anaerovoracaceae bacterium]|jgi:NADH:ubiquinone oxidoreductase subunit E